MKNKLMLYILTFFLIFTFVIDTNAKTVKDMKNELAELEKKKEDANNKKNLTQSEMNQVNKRILAIAETTKKYESNIKTLSDEIVILEKQSAEKEIEIKDVVSFLQVTNSGNAYLEYVFGAQSITDLVFRSAVSEQLVNYNNDLIEDYNETVKAHTAKKKELNEQIVALDSEQANLKVELLKLGDKLDEALDVSISVEDDIVALKKTINYYSITLKCSDDEDISRCGDVPYSGQMIRPINSGRISSNFGWREDPLKSDGSLSFHNGMDMYGTDARVYSAAPGTVAYILYKQGCGGNMVYINHNINGVTYTTAYFHLYQIWVSVNDYVDQNTQIGVMGGGWNTPWDRCSTGQHLHFSTARGLWTSYYNFTAKQVDPRTLVNFPPLGGYFGNRTSKY